MSWYENALMDNINSKMWKYPTPHSLVALIPSTIEDDASYFYFHARKLVAFLE
jgi:hypothetical protein